MPLEKADGEGGPGQSRVDSSQCLEDDADHTADTEDEQNSPVDAACYESEEEEGEASDDDDYLEIVDAADDDLSSEEEAQSCKNETGRGGARLKDGKRKGRARDIDELRLEDYMPEHCIESLEKRDSCSLAITMKYNARSVDITELSGDIVKLVFKGRQNEGGIMATGRPSPRQHGNTKAFARYLSPAIAAANMKRLQKAGSGKLLRVEKCVTRKTSTVGNMLDIFRLPCDCSVRRLKEHFPGSHVLIIKNGFARLEFESVEEVRRALKRPECTSIDGHTIHFSLVKALPGREGAEHRRHSRSTGGDDSGYFSAGRGGDYHNSRAFWRKGWRGEGSHGSRYFWNRRSDC